MDLDRLFERQREFQRFVDFPIDSVRESDRNELSEKYIFKLIEEAVELRKEFPSVANPWSKKQKAADIDRIKEEFCDVVMFAINIALTWKLTPDEIFDALCKVQDNNFRNVKQKKLNQLNSEILSIPGYTSGVGQGNPNAKWIFVGLNPGKGITHGYKFWSNPEDGSSKYLLPNLTDVNDNCYFTNLVKCVTEDNREPTDDEIAFWKPFLDRELEIVRAGSPGAIVVTLGKKVAEHVDGRNVPHPSVVGYGSMSQYDYNMAVSKAMFTSHD